MNNPLISCIMPTFNRAHLLPRAIESMIIQTYPHWELVIVDDGSQDNTNYIVRKYIQKDNRIKFFKNPGKGASAARNYGIIKSKGEWIAFLDDDDENLPNRFESQLNAVSKTDNKFIISGAYKRDQNSKLLEIANKGFWAKGAGLGCSWFISRSLLIKAGLFDPQMPSMQECELSYRIVKHCTYANHFDVVVNVYETSNHISSGQNRIKGKLLVVKKHIDMMPAIEAAWWYYSIALDYFNQGEINNVLKYLKLSAKMDTRNIYRMAYLYAKFFLRFNFYINKINGKVLKLLLHYRFPKLVLHEVIT